MFKIACAGARADRPVGPWLWGAGLGAEYGALAGVGYAGSVGLVALLVALRDGVWEAAQLAGFVAVYAAVVAAVIGAVLGAACGTLVALAAPCSPTGLGGRAAAVLLAIVTATVVLVGVGTDVPPWEVVLGVLALVAWPALFAVPALHLHARAVTRRVHGREAHHSP